jgi:hypothetical protein
MRKHLHEGVLREVLGEFPVTHHAKHERKNGPLVARDQLAMRGVAALEREGDDIGIGKVRKVEGAEHDGECETARSPRSGPVRRGKVRTAQVAIQRQARAVRHNACPSERAR